MPFMMPAGDAVSECRGPDVGVGAQAGPMAFEVVDLRGGLRVPQPALALALALEMRGMRVSVQGQHLHVAGALTAEDRTAIQRWRASLIAITTYCEGGVS